MRERGQPCFKCEAKGPCRHDPHVLEPVIAPEVEEKVEVRKTRYNYRRRRPKKRYISGVLSW